MISTRSIAGRAALALALACAASAPAAAKDEKPVTEAAIRTVLAERKVTLNFPDVALSDAFAFFADITGLNFVLDPGIDPEANCTVRIKDVKLSDAIDLVLGSTGKAIGWEIWRKTIYIAPKDGAAPPVDPPLSRADRTALDAKPVTLNFPGTGVRDVAAFLSGISGVRFSAAEGLEREVKLRVRDLSILDALAVICRTHGLALESEAGGGYVFRAGR